MNSQVAVEFKPLKVLRRLIDYYNRREVIRQLKNTPAKKIDFFKIVLIELKQKMIAKRFYPEYESISGNKYVLPYEPHCQGKIYATRYLLPTHKRFKHRQTLNSMFGIGRGRTGKEEILDNIRHPIIKEIAKEYVTDNLDEEIHPDRMRQIRIALKKRDGGGISHLDVICEKLWEVTYNPKTAPVALLPYLIKTRMYVEKSVTLFHVPHHHYTSPVYLKKYDPVTMKTSNKGLQIGVVQYSLHSDDKERYFGGLKADKLTRLCIRNGFKPIKGKKYQYGDYAKFYMSL
jgi:hypothetical protein